MGIIQEILGRVEFSDNEIGYLDIEVNYSADGQPNIIHLQNNSYRIEMTLNEFIEFSQAIIKSGVTLRAYKEIELNES